VSKRTNVDDRTNEETSNLWSIVIFDVLLFSKLQRDAAFSIVVLVRSLLVSGIVFRSQRKVWQ
jgi:hypothetical protein